MFLFKQKQVQRILFVASEATPFVKAGGLGSVMFSLPRALRRLGCDARLMIPRYASIIPDKFSMEMVREHLSVPTDSTTENEPSHLICNVKRYAPKTNNKNPAPTYFLENEEYYEKRSNIYGYNDDAIRWALLCRGAIEFIRTTDDWTPEIIIASDWQTGFLCNYLKTTYRDDDRLRSIATLFIIHNLSYQGMFDQRFVSEMDYDDGQSSLPPLLSPRLLKINGMRRGIMHADVIATVSPTYAQEIMTTEYGELLDGLLRERRSRVYGILNGIDYEALDPKTDRYLDQNYDAGTLNGRAKNKTELQSRFGLERNRKAFLIAIASRFSEQKGFDLLFPVADVLMHELPLQLAILGSGDGKYMGFFQELEQRYPGRVGTHLAFDEILPHLVHGGADAILIPSRFEPSGLLQLEAMRYGTVPIVRKTGGLADTVEDHNSTNPGTGFVFDKFDPQALMIAIVRAYENFNQRSVWRAIQRRGMEKDYSWEKSAREYARVASFAVGFHKQEIERVE